MKVRLTPEAEADLEAIGDKIAERNAARAATYLQELRDCCHRIGEFPHAAPRRQHWGADIRVTVHGSYLLVHRVRDEAVQILRVVHGARDVDALFADEPLPD